MTRVKGFDLASALQAAIEKGLLSDENPVAVFYDLKHFESECRDLVSAFPKDTVHGFALKACPVVPIVRIAKSCGLGGECASVGELAICNAAGIPPSNIIFDSPAKTDMHLLSALKLGVHINADTIEEVHRVHKLYGNSKSTIGLRINPQVGSASIQLTFTGAKASKFGEPLTEKREELLQVFEQFPFLTCVHVHVGSQGCSQDVLVQGAVAAVEFADEVNAKHPGRVTTIDIGGGLSINYDADEPVSNFGEYAEALRVRVPGLFKYRIITEFGRRIIGNTGWIGARIQAVKESGGKKYIVCHAGADVLLRSVYAPDKWRHRLELFDKTGKPKSQTPLLKYDIAGPLCFSGDIIGTSRELAKAHPGDVLVVRDAGSYTLGMYSRHTSQQVPSVYGYRYGEGTVTFEELKKRETLEDIVRFWGG